MATVLFFPLFYPARPKSLFEAARFQDIATSEPGACAKPLTTAATAALRALQATAKLVLQ